MLGLGQISSCYDDTPMAGKLFADCQIGLQLVGHDSCLRRNHSFDVGCQKCVAVTWDHACLNWTFSADGHMDSGFLGGFPPRVFHLFLESRFAAKVFLIQLNNAVQKPQRCRIRCHHCLSAMSDFPSSLLIGPSHFAKKTEETPLLELIMKYMANSQI